MDELDGRFIIGNQRFESSTKIVSENPATSEPVGEAFLASSEDCRRAVETAKQAFPSWKDLPLKEKKKIFLRAKKILLQKSSDVARLIAREKGSPLPEALAAEVLASLEALDYYGHNLENTIGPRHMRPHSPLFAHKKSAFVFQPLGPMTTRGQLRIVEEHVRDAVEKGAEVLCGGKRLEELPGYFYPPTVLAKVDHSMKIMTEETFGPTLPVMAFSDPGEAVALANDSRYGLTASVWTRNKKLAAWAAEKLEAGSVTVNDHMFSFTEPKAIWGGIKQTGVGRSHGPYGLLELVNIKFVSSDFSGNKGQLWWYPYTSPKAKVLERALILLHGEKFKEKLGALLSFIPHTPVVMAGLSLRSLLKTATRLFRK